MTDTYSLMYEIKRDDFYRDIKDDISEKFDTSNFQESHPSDIKSMNKKIPGMFTMNVEDK